MMKQIQIQFTKLAIFICKHFSDALLVVAQQALLFNSYQLRNDFYPY